MKKYLILLLISMLLFSGCAVVDYAREAIATPIPTEQPTAEPTLEPTMVSTEEPTPSPTPTPKPTPKPTPAPTPTPTPTPSPTPMPEPYVTAGEMGGFSYASAKHNLSFSIIQPDWTYDPPLLAVQVATGDCIYLCPRTNFNALISLSGSDTGSETSDETIDSAIADLRAAEEIEVSSISYKTFNQTDATLCYYTYALGDQVQLCCNVYWTQGSWLYTMQITYTVESESGATAVMEQVLSTFEQITGE